MDQQPNEILEYMLKYLSNLDLTVSIRVNKKWKNLIEKKILYKKVHPSIEECIIDSDFYHMRKYKNIQINHSQKQLIKLTNDKILIKHFRIVENIKIEIDSLLIEYSRIGQINAVKYLLNKGADIHSLDQLAFRISAEKGYIDLVRLFIEKGINYNDATALVWSAYNGHFEVVKFLLEKHTGNDFDNDQIEPKNNIKISRINGINFALTRSAESGHLEIIRLLLEKGANIHEDNDLALAWGAQKGHLEVVRLLLEKGANIHANNDGALRYSAENGHLEVVRLLLEKGANIHADNDYALRWGAARGHLEMVRLLLEKGANIHASYDFALILSAKNGYTEIVKLLLEYGVDPNVINNELNIHE
jgi:ankyrin repeat protein